ncbi:MAG: 23S rRNA (pseudouridine(1915)-N(3))-methyltransferase RlmH, partial [Rikenellaceae bacterium]
REGEVFASTLSDYDYIVLLDERGKQRSSEEFASWIEQCTLKSIKRMAFVIGGAYGFSDDIYTMQKELISLSKMTFSHQMIRLIFIEQLYRAFTIIKGEPYHHK